METRKPTQKSEYLDGIRGWAAFAVFIYHLCFHLPIHLPTYIIWPGNMSVTVFFILSGRVLATSFLKSSNSERLASSAFRRPFRMIVPVMVTLAIHWILYQNNVYLPWEFKAKVIRKGDWWDYAKDNIDIKFTDIFSRALALYLPPNRIPPFPTFSVYWTLPVEFVYSYVVYIVALVASSMKNSRWYFYGILIIIGILNNLDSWLAPFVTGLAIADMTQSGVFVKLNESKWVAMIVQCILVAVGVFFYVTDYSWVDDKGRNVVLEALAEVTITDRPDLPGPFRMSVNFLIVGACLVTSMELSRALRWIFGSMPFRFLGRISFGLYLLHPIVIPSFGAFLAAKLFDPAAGYDQITAQNGTILGIVIVTVLAAWIFYYIADKPSISMGRYVEGYFFAKDFSLEEWTARLKTIVWRKKEYESVNVDETDNAKLEIV